MGQYYKAVILNENNKPKLHASPSDYTDEFEGCKIMEHSWMKNPFVRFIEGYITNNPEKLVWCGDYSDEECPTTISDKEIKLYYEKINSYYSIEELKDKGINLNGLAKLTPSLKLVNVEFIAPLRVKYLINHDKKEFVDKSKIPFDFDNWQIHPLPLLTCEGNGRGGGDFRNENCDEFVGRWSRDKISATSRKSEIPKGFEEIIPNFIE